MKKMLIVLLTISFGTFLLAQEIVPTGIPTERSGGSYLLHESDGIPIGGDEIPLTITPGAGFFGFDFDDNPPNNPPGYLFIPPDPIGAAGTDRVVAVVNCMIECRDKSGTQLWISSLKSFFSTAPLNLGTSTFDPKVVWDHYADRFVVVTLERWDVSASGDPTDESRILLAVSKTATPATATAADWWFHGIDSKITITNPCWADYPGFEIDEDAVYITNNMFEFDPSYSYNGARLWIVDKHGGGDWYNFGAAPPTGVYDSHALAGVAANFETMMPALVFGAGGVIPPSFGDGTFLVGYGRWVAAPNEYGQVIRVDDPLGTGGGPTFTHTWINMGDIDNVAAVLPDAPQLGSSMDIETNSRRALDAVWRNDPNHSPILWFTTTIDPNYAPNAGQATAHYFMLDTSAWPPNLIHQDDIGAEDLGVGTHTFFPSLAVDSQGNAYFGFAASNAAMYCGAYAAGTHWNDALGPADPLRPTETIQAGLDEYERTFAPTDPNRRNRWGDYSGAALDPVTENVWIFNEYAMTRGSGTPPEDGRWGTAWGTGDFHVPVILVSFTAEAANQGVVLNWRTESEIENLGFIIERKVTGGSWNEIVSYKTDTNLEGQGSTSGATDYSYLDQLVKEGNTYEYRLADVDYNGLVNYNSVRTVVVDKPQIRSTGIPTEILMDAYPNPFNPSTTISYGIPNDKLTAVQVQVFDISGRLVNTLVNEEQSAGWHNVQWNGTNGFGKTVPAGIYIGRVTAGNEIKTTKLMLLK